MNVIHGVTRLNSKVVFCTITISSLALGPSLIPHTDRHTNVYTHIHNIIP